MSNFQFSSDLIDDALFRAGEPIDGSSDYDAAALRYLNRAYQAIWMGGAELDPQINEDWHWLMSTSPGVITLSPTIVAGTVSVINNSAAITFSSAPADSVAGWFFKTNTNADIFRISVHTAAATAATLDSVYTAATESVAGYTLFKHEYTLASDVLRLLSPMRVYRDGVRSISGISLPSLENMYPLNQVRIGVPAAFAQVGSSKVRFSHCGSDTAGEYTRIDYDYLQRPADLTDSGSEEPLLPRERRRVLSDFVTFWLLMDKNDNRADGVGLVAKSGLKAMAVENRHHWATLAGGVYRMGHIAPRQGDTGQYSGVVRTQSGLIIA